MVVISFVLLMSCVMLGKDIDVLVIAPLETMSKMVKKLSANPMSQVKSETVEGLESGEGQKFSKVSALQCVLSEAIPDLTFENFRR